MIHLSEKNDKCEDFGGFGGKMLLFPVFLYEFATKIVHCQSLYILYVGLN